VVRLWDVRSGRELRQFPGDRDALSSVAFDPSGQRLAVGSHLGNIHVWDVALGKLLWQRGDLKDVADLAFSADGKTLTAMGGGADKQQNRVFTRWDATTGEERGRSTAQEDAYIGALAPDGSSYASPTADGKVIRLLDPANGQELRRTEGEADWPAYTAFSGDGRLLTATSRDGVVRVWETASGKQRHRLTGLPKGILHIALSRDGTILAETGFREQTIHLWDLGTARELHAFGGHRVGPLDLAFLDEGRAVGTASANWSEVYPPLKGTDWSLRRWEVASGKELGVTRHDLGGELRLSAFSPDGNLLATVIHDGTLRLWDVRAGQELRAWKVPTSEVRSVSGTQVEKFPRAAISEPAFSYDGKTMFAAHGPLVVRWDVATGQEFPSLKTPATSPFTRCFPAPDGQTLLMADPDTHNPRLFLLELTSGRTLQEIRTALNPRSTCAFSPDGKTLAVGGVVVSLWEVSSGQGRGRLEGDGACGLAFSPDGRLLAVAQGPTPTLRLWHLASGRPLGGLSAELDGLGALRFSPDGRRLAVAEAGNTALVCDVAGLLREPLPAPAKLSAADLEALWDELSGTDGAQAYRAIQRLAAAPEGAPFLKRRRLRPPEPDERRLARLVADLDADEFAGREGASRELAGLGLKAEATLRRALGGRRVWRCVAGWRTCWRS
jgi:WD40 repeat protein